MQVATNSKFGAFFLSRCDVSADLPEEEEIEPRVWMSQRLGFDIAEHWRTWLGSIETDEMNEGGLGMYVTAPSATPDITDGENVALHQRANDLLNGLLLQGVPRFERGFVVHGSNRNRDIQIRGHSSMERHYLTGGLDFVVGMTEVRRAVVLAHRIRHLENSVPDWGRLMRGIRALLLANRHSNEAGDRLHQFVRVLEALIKPRIGGSRADFAHRGQTLARNNAETRDALLQLYDLRSQIEHLNVPTDALPPEGTEIERHDIVNRRTRQVETLARFSFLKILEAPHLLTAFRTDEQIDAFWRREHEERLRLWGERVDIFGVP